MPPRRWLRRVIRRYVRGTLWLLAGLLEEHVTAWKLGVSVGWLRDRRERMYAVLSQR